MAKSYLSFIFKTTGLFLFWFILSGKTAPVYLLTGLACSAVIAGIHNRPASALPRPSVLFRSVAYFAWLLTRVILAAWHVSLVILNPRMPIRPAVIRHKTPLKRETAKVLFGNSITLTPGTITAGIEGDEFIIHRLDEESSGDITTGLMEKKIAAIFGGQG